MAEPFLGQIKIAGFNFPPRGYAQCDGAILPISQNQSLYSLLGTNYGGDGRSTFALPELRGRTPVFNGTGPSGFNPTLGQKGGQPTVTLTIAELPSHQHRLVGSTDAATTTDATNAVLGKGTSNVYRADGTTAALSNNASLLNGGGQSHNNMQPYLAVNFFIALQGTFPSRN